MGVFMSTHRSLLIVAALSPLALVVSPTPGFAACTFPTGSTPGSCFYAGTGPALTITDSASSTVAPAPSAFKGNATGTDGHGIAGAATGKNGIGGLFQALAPSTATTSTTALEATNSGGSTSAEGNYGSAGIFKITNAQNQSPGVSITTNGINSYGLSVVNSGTLDGTFNSGQLDNQGGMAGYFEITNANGRDQSAVYGISTGRTGDAGEFVTSDASNTDETVYIETLAPGGIAAHGIVSGTGGGGSGVVGTDETSGGGTGIFGASTAGNSGNFSGGSGGTNSCTYNGSSSGWSCNAALAMMDDRTAPNYGELLDKLDGMPMAYFHTHGAKKPVRELGMSAEDFRAAFGLGKDDKTIAEGNAYGVALAAAKGLYQKLKVDDAEIAALKARLATQDSAMAAMQATVARLAQGAGGMKQASLTTH
jgi:hypothetical protein